MKKMQKKGFTLLEILLVIALIGILVTIILVVLNPQARFASARNDIRKSDIQELELALTQYRLQEGVYPAGLDGTLREICDPDASSCSGFVDLSALVPTYIQSIPQDPQDTDSIDGTGYQVAVNITRNIVAIESIQAEASAIIAINNPLPPEIGGPPSISLVLDEYPNASAAYSLRKLRTAYTGNAIRVRRSSDNVEQDIGFVNNELDTTALVSFIGSNSGFISTWYDQSGNGRDAVQTTTLVQPRIVNAGATKAIGNNIAIDFDRDKGVRYLGQTTVEMVYSTVRSEFSTFQHWHTILDSTTTATRIGGILENTNTGVHNNVSPNLIWRNGISQAISTTGILAPITNSMQITYTKNAGRSNNLPGITIGNYDTTSFGGSALMSEIIAYPVVDVGNRSAIENNINQYYSIY
jgi:prepilin-type N-terminal cleavage/methylation domain-containing protein